jgi:surface carbohydrate biosynthesis protein (TIGR04326 family)
MKMRYAELVLNQPTENHPTFLIWDTEGRPPKGKWIPILWRSYGEGDDLMYSIPRLVEEKSDALRELFLDWIYDLGELHIEGKRLVDHLELRPGFSYWWMTLITEKSNAFKSLQIINVLKLLALEELIRTYLVFTIILVSGDKTLVQAFRLWCKNAALEFEWRPLRRRTGFAPWIIRLYHSLPQAVQAGLSLFRYIKHRWPLRQVGTPYLTKSTANITFCSYFDNLDKGAAGQDRFFSFYWTRLPKAIADNGVSTNWLQLYVQDELNPTAQHAQGLITRFNRNNTKSQCHTTQDGVLGLSVIVRTLRDYGSIVRAGLRLRKVRRQFRPAGSNIDLWPLYKQDWCNSMYGTTAMSNCLFLNLFEYTLRCLPRQRLGVYLQENQAWEMSFIHAWKAAGHGLLIGVPHSTVRYWDLRYFFDPRNYQRTGKNDLPLPDKVALNGPAAMAAYRKGGYPSDRMVEVEALRYLYLADLPPMQRVANVPSTAALRVLVLTDYLPAVTRRQMQWLVEAVPLLSPDTRFIVKAHPNCPVKAGDYPSLPLQITSLPLAELLGEYDVVYSSNITTAAVDAYSAGVTVVSVLDGDSLNMSPLRGLSEVRFVTSPTALAEALSNRSVLDRGCKRTDYFTVDSALSRWRALLSKVTNEQVL